MTMADEKSADKGRGVRITGGRRGWAGHYWRHEKYGAAASPSLTTGIDDS